MQLLSSTLTAPGECGIAFGVHTGEFVAGMAFILWVVPPENTYCQIFLNYFRREVNLVSSVIVAAEEDPEP